MMSLTTGQPRILGDFPLLLAVLEAFPVFLSSALFSLVAFAAEHLTVFDLGAPLPIFLVIPHFL